MASKVNPWLNLNAAVPPRFFDTLIVDSSLQHNFLWVVNQFGQRGLALTVPRELPENISFPELDNIEVSVQPDKKTIAIILVDEDHLRQFRIFCEDCIIIIEQNASRDVMSIVATLNKAIESWVSLLKRGRRGLSMSTELGLVGELFVIRETLCNAFSLADCVKGWNGPKGHEQDFLLNRCLVEVKCQLASRDKIVKISSLEQLDCISGQIYLSHVGLSVADGVVAGSFSLSQMVDDLIQQMVGDNYSIDTFLGKLELLSYVHGKTECSNNYINSFSNFYRIDDKFPRLVRGDVPPAIENSTYKLNMAVLQNWEISSNDMLKEMLV